MTPKRDPRSTRKRPKTEIKIDPNLDAKTKRVGHGSARRLWAGTPPQGGAPGALGGGPGGTGAAPRHPCARYTSIHNTVYRVLKYTVYWYTGHLYTVYWYTGYLSIQYIGMQGTLVYSILVHTSLVYSILVYRVLKYTVY